MFRLTSFLDRRPELSHAEFIDYWSRQHSPLAAELPGLQKYSTVRPQSPESAPYDGVAELYFDTREAFNRVLGSSADTDAINDVPNFIDSTTRYHLTDIVHSENSNPSSQQTLDTETPVVQQENFPFTEYVGFRRRETVDEETFSDNLTSIIDRECQSIAVGSFTVGRPTEDNRRESLDVLLKRTVNEMSDDAVSTPAGRYGSLLELADVTVEFAGYERVVVDEI